MSKVDSADIQARVQAQVQAEVQRTRGDLRGEGKLSVHSHDEILQMLMRMIERERVDTSRMLHVDFTATSAQLRAVVADELLKIMHQVPGFTPPQVAAPPTPEDVKQLLKAMQTLEKDGSLKNADAFKGARAETAAQQSAGRMDTDSSPVAKAWSQFVQQATAAQSARPDQALRKDGANDGAAPHELLMREMPAAETARSTGLRTPSQAGEPFAGLNNKQKLDLMSNGFGRELAMSLKQMAVRDPAALLKHAALPEAREQLAKALGVSRSELTVHLARAELLTIGPGRTGEQALRPQHLPALTQANLVTLKQLGALHGVPSEQFANAFATVRQNFSGFARAMSGERPILKKDLQHWAKSAARKKSSLLDADWEDLPKGQGDAEEMIMSWYLEHWAELEGQKQKATEKEQQRREKEALMAEAEKKLALPESKYDPARDDGLICFWIERPNLDVLRPALTEMVYVCLDPKTGMIEMKQKE